MLKRVIAVWAYSEERVDNSVNKVKARTHKKRAGTIIAFLIMERDPLTLADSAWNE